MLKSISLTSSMRSNLQSLKTIALQMGKTQNILSTGQKVNSAIDNASSYYQARSLTNRAADLNNLLDAMGQGIQTIQAATQGLINATSVINQADTVLQEANVLLKNYVPKTVTKEGIKNKQYLENQEGVFFFTNRNGETISSVVTNAEDLLDAVNSKKSGNIIVLGDINMGANSIVLNDDQNLVGVEKYKVGNLYQYSKLTFDDVNFGICAGNNSQIGWLDLDVSVKSVAGNAAVNIDGKTKVVLQNININFCTTGTKSVATAAVFLKNDAIADVFGELNIKTTGNARNYGVSYTENSQINLYDAKLSIYLTGTSNCFSIMGTLGEMNLYGTSELYSEQPNCTRAIITSHGSVCLKSDQAKIFLNNSKPFYGSDGVNGDSRISVVKGAEIIINSAKYIAKNDAEDIMIKGGANPNNSYNLSNQFTEDVASDEEKEKLKNAIDYIKSANFNENQNMSPEYDKYYYEEIEYSIELEKIENCHSRYSDIINEYYKILSDSNYMGINLLLGADERIVLNESRSNVFVIKGKNLSEVILKTPKWENLDDLEKTSDRLKEALNEIQNFQTELGNNYSIIQTRQKFTEALCDVLETGADDLILADMNEVSAEYLMLQTRGQLATNSLSLAAQSAQNVLSLF